MRRPLPVALAILSAIILVCACGGLLSSLIQVLLSQDTGTILPLLITVPLGGLGIFAAVSALLRADEAYSRLVFYGNVYRGVAILFAVVGLGMFILGMLTDPQMAGYGCALLAGGTISLLWYRVIRAVLRRKDVLDAYGMDLYE